MDIGQDHLFINLSGQKTVINTPSDFYKSTFNVDGFPTDRYEFVNGTVLTVTHKGNTDFLDSNFRITQLKNGNFAFTKIPNPTFQDLHA
nr:hypothetical protein [Limosilactobacillus mucosae]